MLTSDQLLEVFHDAVRAKAAGQAVMKFSPDKIIEAIQMLQAAEARINDLEDKTDQDELEAEISRLRDEVTEAEQYLGEANARIAELEEQVESLSTQLADATS